MSSTQNFTKAKVFNPSNITYREPTTNKRGGKNVQVQLNGQPLVLQIPLMLTWGVNERVDDDSGRVSYDMALQFQPEKHQSIASFLAAMKKMEDKIKNDAVTNSRLWFGKKNMTRDVIDVLMYPLLKYPKKKDDSGDFDYERSPTLKLKVPFWEGVFNVELYDMGKTALYLPPKKGQEPEFDLTPMDHITKGSNVKGLIQCTGLWFAGGKCGCTWKIVQAQVQRPMRLVGSGKCQIADDSDDEELAEAYAPNESKHQSTETVDDSDNDAPTFSDGNSSAEEKSVTPPPKPKKKKVVRRKKVKVST